MARGIGCTPIYLGRIFTRKSTSAMSSASPIGIHNNLTAGKPRISMRATNDELSGRVYNQFRISVHPLSGNNFGDQMGLYISFNLLLLHTLVTIGRASCRERQYR